MRGRFGGSSAKRALNIGAVVAMTALAAGCSSSTMRIPGANLFSANNDPDAATSTTAIESRDLGPLGTPTVTAAAAPGTVTTPGTLRQRGWSVEGAPIVELSAGDTAQTLSQGFNVPVDVILEANGLVSPAQLRPGSRVIIPTYVRVDQPGNDFNAPIAMAATTNAAQNAPQAPGMGAPANLGTSTTLGTAPTTLNAQANERRHTVQPGETLYSVARTYNVPHTAIASANGLSPDAYVQSGQTLRIPGGNGAPTQVAVAPTATAPATTSPVGTAPAAPTQVAVASTQPVQSAPAAPVQSAPPQATAPVAAAPAQQASGFQWPVKGRMLAGFGKQPDGDSNEGINLAAPAGTPVQAADGGKVIYAGNELEGYGNLILIQHSDEWVSAYAHNADLRVSRGDTVRKGQTIASVGATGSVSEPQLHFELRRSSTPVDPLPHLSGA